jgi:hypothetical protein
MKPNRPRAALGALTGTGAALALAIALAPRPAVAAAPPLSVAIVVGSNQSPTSSQENLRYGDDDAVQNARTFSLLGAETTLLVSPDAETRELFPSVKPHAAATRAALRQAFADAMASLAAAHKAGRATELYFLFAGHGDMADGRAFLQVDDGRLYREDLAELLRGAGADENHVLVDACYAASFVSDRGPGGARENLPPGFSRTQVAWPKRTGFLTARSSGGQTHEWAEYQSGVFSHELRSGLLGAADVDVDGKVTYREIAAFVHRANEAIPNRRYRPEVSTMPPGGDLDAALALLPSGPMVLEMDVASAGRSFVETERGVRLVDLNPGTGAAIKLRLPVDDGGLFVHQLAAAGADASTAREFKLAPRAGQVLLSSLEAQPSQVRARGAGHEALLHLFAKPFDAAAVTSFSLDDSDAAELRWEQEAQDARDRQSFRRKLALGAFGTSVATAAIGAGYWWSGHNLFESTKTGGSNAGSDEAPLAKAQGNHDYLVRNVLFGVAGASAVTGSLLYFWPSAPHVSVSATPGCEACVAYQKSF